MIRVLINQSVAGNADPRYGLADFSFRPGEIVDIDNKLAEAWFASGIATSKEEIEAKLPPPPLPESPSDNPVPPAEVGILHAPLNDSTDDIVALDDKSVFAVAGTRLQLDSELMTVVDASDPNNLRVTRAAGGSTIAAHAAGIDVLIGVSEAPPVKAGNANQSLPGESPKPEPMRKKPPARER